MIGFVLAGCSVAIEPVSEQTISSSIISSSSAGDGWFPEVLDQSFTSSRQGIAFRYPSYISDGAGTRIPITAHEQDDGVLFRIPEEYAARGWQAPPPIYAKRALAQEAVVDFSRRIFPSHCTIGAGQPADNAAWTTFAMTTVDETDVDKNMQCSASLVWDHATKVVWYSSLFTKNSGILWMPDADDQHTLSSYNMMSMEEAIRFTFRTIP
jgi:hypothetical protein